MESGDNQYCYCWNRDLHLYSDCRSVRNCYDDDGYYGNRFDHTDFCCNRHYMSKQYCSCLACNFDKYSGHNRNLESGDNQYDHAGYNNLYLYP